MKNFTIMVDFNGGRYECFVQQLKGAAEVVYIVNFCNSDLIRLCKGKRIVLCKSDKEYGRKSRHTQPGEQSAPALFEECVWNALNKQEETAQAFLHV